MLFERVSVNSSVVPLWDIHKESVGLPEGISAFLLYMNVQMVLRRGRKLVLETPFGCRIRRFGFDSRSSMW